MVFPSLIIRLAAPIGEWWLPGLGVLLTGCGVGLLSVSAGELVAPTHPANPAIRSAVVVETIASRVTPPAPAVGEASSGPGKAALATPKRSRRPANCLGAHLATVPVQRLADCDVRAAIVGLAVLALAGRGTGEDPAPGDGAVPREAEGLDLAAAALYGPPDRRPQATQEALLEERVPDGGRGRDRDDLEETATTRFLGP
jgi:hypothetical protein